MIFGNKESVLMKVYRYLLRRWFGNYIASEICNEENQIQVNLKAGTASIQKLYLNPKPLNEILQEFNCPFTITDCFVGQICLNIPWMRILSESSIVNIDNLRVTFKVKQQDDFAASMIESMWKSATSPSSVDEDLGDIQEIQKSMPFGATLNIADALETIIKKIKVNLTNPKFYIEYSPKNSPVGLGIKLEAAYIAYADESSDDPQKDDTTNLLKDEKFKGDTRQSYTTQKIHVEGVSLYSYEFVNKQDDYAEETDSNSDISKETMENTTDEETDKQKYVMMGRFSKNLEILLRLKITEDLEGPKVSIFVDMGYLSLMITPRQLNLLFEVVQGCLSSPDGSNEPSNLRQRCPGKPMQTEHFDCIGANLQAFLSPSSPFQSDALSNRQGWASGSQDDDEFCENFKSLRRPSAASYDSTTFCSMDSSFSASTITSICSESTCKSHKRVNKLDVDPTAIISQFEVHLGSLSVVLLNEDVLDESSDPNYSLTPSSVMQLQRIAEEFFQRSTSLTSCIDFKMANTILDQACSKNHLRLLAGSLHFEADQKKTNTAFFVGGFVESIKLEVTEMFYKTNSEEVEDHVPLLRFNDGVSNLEKSAIAKSVFKLIFKLDQRTTKSGEVKGESKTNLQFELAECSVDADVSIIDRIAPLLNMPPICVVNKPVNPWMTGNTSTTTSSYKMNLKLSSPLMVISLRFPKLDLRRHHVNKVPWYKRNVHSDYLTVKLSNMSVQTTIQTNQTEQEYKLQCRTLSAFYHEDSKAIPLPICKAGVEEKKYSSTQDLLSDCRLNFKFLPPKKPSLEETPPKTPNLMTMSLAGFLEAQIPSNGPFSLKQVIHESDTPHVKNQPTKEKQLLIPGEKVEISNFIKLATDSSRRQVEIFFPTVSMQLISKFLYEIIYNRLVNNLLLWEPSAPKPKFTVPILDGCEDSEGFDTDSSDAYFICRPGIHFESNPESGDDIDDESDMYYSASSSKLKTLTRKRLIANSPEESYLSLNLKIGTGILCLFGNVRDATTNNVIPGQQSEFLINVQESTLFMVNGYMGDPNVSYVSMEMNKTVMHHCEMMSKPSHSPPLKDIGAVPGQHLHSVIYPSEAGTLVTSKNNGKDRDNVTLCVKIQEYHEVHNVKNIFISAGFNKVTLRNQTSSAWLTQLIDFFSVTDYPVPGYEPVKVLTEMHTHFWDSAIDYRPIYIPWRVVISVGNLIISSHLNPDITSKSFRIILEEVGLFLAQSPLVKGKARFIGPIDLKKDYVNIFDIGLLEFSVRSGDGSKESPLTDLRFSNNILHIHTCADSAIGISTVMTYFVNGGDLNPPSDLESSGSAFSSPRHQSSQELINVDVPQESGSNLSESQQQQIYDLIEDALNNPEPPARVKSRSYYNFPTERHDFEDDRRAFPQVSRELGQVEYQDESDTDDDFYIVDEEFDFKKPQDGISEIKWLTDEPVRIVENYFLVPSEKSDPLKTPDSFPPPKFRYTLCEMNIIWHLYGGKDFGRVDPQKKSVNFVDSVSFSSKVDEKVTFCRDRNQKYRTAWLTRGGVNRDHDTIMELRLNKVRLKFEMYPEKALQVWRLALTMGEVEIIDKLKCSDIKKFLHLYTSQEKPKRSNANMIAAKMLSVKPDPQINRQECDVKISILPLRFNVDQDALQFLINFFLEFVSGSTEDTASTVSSKQSTPVHHPPVLTVTDVNEKIEDARKKVEENLLLLMSQTNQEDYPSEDISSSTCSAVEDDAPLYFRKVIFSPDVPIKLDYQGKRVDLTHGPMQGLLLRFTNLNSSEIKLKKICHRHGILGVKKLCMFLVNQWIEDIRRNQIPSILAGIGPLLSIVQILRGIKDLFCMPYEQYKKDGRILRGLNRGANSFTTSTAMAALELTTRLIYLIQLTAETAFDMLSSAQSITMKPSTNVRGKGRKKRYSRPKDIRQGVANAYMLVKEGIEETADNIVQVATYEHEQKGYSGAVGGVIRQIPPTIIKPIIIAAEATDNLLGGVRCQLVPDASKEATEKYRSDDEDT